MMPLKRFLLLIIVLASMLNLSAQQQSADIGLLGGGAIPFSDYSKLNIGQSIHFNFGGFYRYNFNSRFSLRINAMYGKVGANGFLDNIQQPISFNKSVFDLGAFFEINYLDFILGAKKMKFSPYVFYGAGVSFYPDISGGAVIAPNFPFGAGAKYAIGKRWGIGAEVSTRKLMNDKLDNLDDPYSTVNLGRVTDKLHNNDWINYFGLTLSYKFYWGTKPCPAYNSIND